MSVTVTYHMLSQMGACYPQLSLFSKLFGDSVEVTEDIVKENVDRFEWDWAAEYLLPKSSYLEYMDSLSAMLRKTETDISLALHEYETAIQPAYETYRSALWVAVRNFETASEYNAAEKAVDLIYREATKDALDKYDRLSSAAHHEYDEAASMVWFRLATEKGLRDFS